MVAGLGAASVESVHLADSFELSHARLQNAIENSGASVSQFTGEIDKQHSSFALLGIDQGKYEAALAALTSATNSPKQALGDMGVVADLAAAKHLDLEKAAILVGKVVNGQTTALKRYGIDLGISAGGVTKVHAAQAKLVTVTTALNNLQDKDHAKKKLTIADLQAFQKAQLAVKIAQQNINDAQTAGDQGLAALGARFSGAASEQADTFAGKMAGLKAEVTNLGIRFGIWLIPKLEAAGRAIASLIGWFQKHQGAAKALAIVVGGVLVAAIGAYLVSLATAVALTIAAAAPFLLVGAAVVGLGVLLTKLGVNWGNVWRGMQRVYYDLKLDVVVGALGTALGAIKTAILWLRDNWSSIWTDIENVTISTINGIGGALNQGLRVLNDLSQGLNDILPGSPFGKIGNIGSLGHVAVPAGGATQYKPGAIGPFVDPGGASQYKKGSIGPKIPFYGPIPRAAGGRVTAGMPYWVGERGPEPFIPDRNGTIVPSNQATGSHGPAVLITGNTLVAVDPVDLAQETARRFVAQVASTGQGIPIPA